MQLVLDRVSHKVGAETWLHPMSLCLQSGAVTVLLGATQAGKTSLMRIMAGLDTPTAGRVGVDGFDVTGRDLQMNLITAKQVADIVAAAKWP
jgi:glycerol transport system ATP-binding protein